MEQNQEKSKQRSMSRKKINPLTQNQNNIPLLLTTVQDDSYFEVKRVVKNTQPPKPETAPNKFLAQLFQSPTLNSISVGWIRERAINFMKVLGKRRIDMIMLRSLSFRGVPQEIPGLRPIVWRVLLGYLPRETAKWEQFLKNQKQIYKDWRKELIVEPHLLDRDHPLSTHQGSKWSKFFNDQELWEEIEKDVRRPGLT
eukprot:403350997